MSDDTPPSGPGKPDHQRTGPVPVADLKTKVDKAKAELRKYISSAQRHLPEMAEHLGIRAKHRRMLYLAYLREGFTAEQALELLKAESAAGKV